MMYINGRSVAFELCGFAIYLHFRKWVLPVVLFLFSLPALVSSQDITQLDSQTGIVMEFVSTDIDLPAAGTTFNVLKVTNNRSKSFAGTLRVTVPEGWRIIGADGATVSVNPGEEFMFPLRITIPPSVLGGISYMVNAELRGEDYYDYTTSYISIAPVSRWDMFVDSKNIYLSEYSPQGEFNVRLSNTGNANEMIKLAFDTGELLEYVNPIEGDSLMFVEVPAFKDTSLTFRVRQRTDLSYAEERAMINNWKSSSIYMVASTPDRKTSAGVRVQPLESRVENDINRRSSPLNLDMTINNLLSYQLPKASVKLSGKILFPDDQQVQYNVGFYNIYFDPQRYQDFDLYQFVRFMLRYNDRNTSVTIGDRIGMGELHTLSGQGIRAEHRIKDQHTLYFNASNNPYTKNVGVFTGYSSVIKNIAVNAGTTLETTTNSGDSHYSFQLGSTVNFLRYHRIRVLTLASIDRFSNSSPYLANDTTRAGFAYRFSYNYNGKKFQLGIDNTNTRMSYLRNAGVNRINIRSVYRLSDSKRIEGVYYRNSYDAARYPYNFMYPSNKNITDNGHLLYSINKGNIVYYTGPYVTNLVRLYYNPANSFSTRYGNIQPGMMGSATFRLGMMRSITPYLRLNSMFVNYSSEDPDFVPYQINGLFQYTLGLSYYDRAFKFNAYFTTGEASDIYRSVVVEQDPQVNQSFHVRPYYERYFNHEKIRVSGYLNYSYYLPSTRENMIVNTTSDFFLEDGWRIFVSMNVYRIVRADETAGRVTTRDMNILTGIRKTFDIQQPRLKYFDLTIVGFDDENGNGIKDNTEKPISNVMIQLSRDNKKNLVQRTGFSETSLITDPNGEIYYEDIPEGIYDLKITALSNLENLYFLNGQNQVLEVHDDMIHYLPLVESYKVKGKIIVDRDPNSNEGNISLEGIRITAVSDDGETYSTLTDAFGGYMLSLPRATVYEVSIYNVFGEQFNLEQGRYRVQFSANKTVSLDFKFTERRRQLQFRDSEQFFDFNIQRQN